MRDWGKYIKHCRSFTIQWLSFIYIKLGNPLTNVICEAGPMTHTISQCKHICGVMEVEEWRTLAIKYIYYPWSTDGGVDVREVLYVSSFNAVYLCISIWFGIPLLEYIYLSVLNLILFHSSETDTFLSRE